LQEEPNIKDAYKKIKDKYWDGELFQRSNTINMLFGFEMIDIHI